MAATATTKKPASAAKTEEKAEEKPTAIYQGDDAFESMLVESAAQFVTQYSETVTKLAAADGDREKAIKTFVESSTHEEAVAIRATIAAANERLHKLAEENVVSLTLSEEEKNELKTLSTTLREKSKSAIDTIEGTLNMMPVPSEPLRNAIEVLKSRMPAQTRGRRPGDAGSNLPRARVNLYVTGGALENQHFESFSKLAIAFNCDAGDLQKAYANEAGVDHMDIKNVKTTVTFKFQPNGNGSEYEIRVTPKETAKSGPKPKSEGESKTAEGNKAETAA